MTVERTVPLRDGVLELGELALTSHAPVLRGRVVDARGRPVPAAQVVAQGPTSAGAIADVPVSVDGDGRFVLAGPVFRDARGDVGAAVVTASLPHVHPRQLAPQPPPFRSGAATVAPPGDAIELVVPDAATGAFAMVVHGAPQAFRQQLQVCVLDGNNQRLLHDERLLAPKEAGAWHRGSIEAPVGRRTVQLRAFNHVLCEVEIDIQPTRPNDANAVQVHTVAWDAIVRPRAIRAVDAAGQVIPAARVHMRTAGHKSGTIPDASGQLVWLQPLQLRHAAYLIAPGKQMIQLPETASGDVTMVEATPLPLDVKVAAGEQLAGDWKVMLDPCEDTGLASYGTLSANSEVRFPGPPPGRYHVAMFVRFDQFTRRVRVGTIDVAESKAMPGSLTIDAATLAALRVLQAEPPPKK